VCTDLLQTIDQLTVLATGSKSPPEYKPTVSPAPNQIRFVAFLNLFWSQRLLELLFQQAVANRKTGADVGTMRERTPSRSKSATNWEKEEWQQFPLPKIAMKKPKQPVLVRIRF
jgi:hypothetical protein